MRGFSTLEVIIAMTIMLMTVSAVILTTFGNQSLILGGQTNAEAMQKAQELLENAQASARRDFNLVNATTSIDDIYTKTVTVALVPPNYLTKEVTARIDWKDDHLTPKYLTLTTLISNFENAAAGSTCNSSPSGNWHAPAITNYDLGALSGYWSAGSLSNASTSLDAFRGRVYVGLEKVPNASTPTFFTLDITGSAPTYVANGYYDVGGSTLTRGVNALAVATSTGKLYAFVATAAQPDFTTCTPGVACSQLQVLELGSGAPQLVKYFTFATSSTSVPNQLPYVSGSGGQGTINSLFYKNGYLFLGLKSSPVGPEFILLDAHDSTDPKVVGYYDVGATVESVFMRNNFVYLATNSSASPLLILDVTNPVTPVVKWSDTVSAGINKGNSFAAVGDALYFTRDSDGGAIPEWYVLDNADVRVAKPTVTTSYNPNQSVQNIYVRDYLAYLVVGNILQTRSATSTAQWAPSLALPGNGTAIDCEGNTVYVGSSTGTVSTITAP